MNLSQEECEVLVYLKKKNVYYHSQQSWQELVFSPDNVLQVRMSTRPGWHRAKWSFPSQSFLLPISMWSTRFLLFTVSNPGVILTHSDSSSISDESLTLLIFPFLKSLSYSLSIPAVVRAPHVFSWLWWQLPNWPLSFISLYPVNPV